MPKPPRLDRRRRRAPGLLNWLASARARAVVDSAAADFYFAIIRSTTGRTHGVVSRGRCQSHPGSIDGGVEDPGLLNWLASRAREGGGEFGGGGFLFRDYQITTGRTHGVVR